MSDQFVGEIRIFAGNFEPNGWAFCNGQLLSINQNTALFSLLGTRYGGDGMTTFALPKLIGRSPLHQGAGPGLTPRAVGEMVGEENVTLDIQTIPAHSHQAVASLGGGSTGNPTGNVFAEAPSPAPHQPGAPVYSATTPDVTMSPLALSVTGGGQPHNNIQPYLGLNFIIALQGVFPNRG